MWFIEVNDENKVVALSPNITDSMKENGYICRHDFENYEQAEFWAEAASEFSGKPFHAMDRGKCVSPRFDIYELPQIGHDVSYGFNGDYYPAGMIDSISKTMKRITTDQGEVFYGDKKTGRWIRKGGTWTMVRGIRDERNPHF